MLLAIDAGNTNSVPGVHEGRKPLDHRRLETNPHRTDGEYGILVRQLLEHARIAAAGVRAVAVSSVVPPMRIIHERNHAP